jgi:hypothetical protein
MVPSLQVDPILNNRTSSARIDNRLRLFALAALMALFVPRTWAVTIADGPYVMRADDGSWVARWIAGDVTEPRIREERLSAGISLRGKSVTVPAVGNLPEFKVNLRTPETGPRGVAPDEVPLGAGTKLFVVADTHGEFEIVVELLQKQGVIDEALQWSFGKGHLAVLGDVFDRGAHHTEIFWLLYELEAQARRAGGGVHVLLGNHETLVLLGARQYLHPKYPAVTRALGAPSYAALWGDSTLLGAWLRTKASVQKIGGYLCLHGGISPETLTRGYTLASMNQTVRDMLSYTPPYTGPNVRYAPGDLQILAGRRPAATAADRESAAFLVMHPLGPLWYRGYFRESALENGFPVASDDDVRNVLDHFSARAILVGHTQVPTVTALYDGRVIAVQVYPRRDDAGRAGMEGLLIRDGEFFRARIDGSTEKL